MRVVQPAGTRGSLKWMQRLVDQIPDALDAPLWQAGLLDVNERLCWLSPLAADQWAEYRDAAFLDRLGRADLWPHLRQVWPARGPQWDALAVDAVGGVFLFEAKAHPHEMSSRCQATSVSSRKKITRSLDAARHAYGVKSEVSWLDGYYQYANRLVHLAFLRAHGVDARMVFLYFVGDEEMGGPRTAADWLPHLSAVHAHLGLSGYPSHVCALFRDVPF